MHMIECIGGFVAILVFLFIHFWRRNRDEILPNWPIIGMLPVLLRHMSDLHDHITLVMNIHGGTFRFQGPWFTDTSFIVTADPINVEHITCKNFGNYGKGYNFQEIFNFFGDSILTVNSHVWKQERIMVQSILKRKSFNNLFQKTIQNKLVNCLLPFLNDVSKLGIQVDLQDVFGRFTFDNIIVTLFGFDPNSLPIKFSELRDISYLKSPHVIEQVIFYRHFIPVCLWRVQKWLRVGPENKYKVASENLNRFLSERISAFSKRKDMDECFFDMMKALTKEENGKEEMSEKYVRDTAATLLLAGNSPVTSGLSWFFWLVSNHPIVEAKIIQEIKDSYPTQEENLITSLCLEEVDKLVYLHAAICEALRLYPPIPFEHICAIKSDVLPSGQDVSPNTKLIYFMYSMGRMEEIWGEDCKEFKPERWISPRGKIIHVPSYKFVTFNAGPRSCLGKNLAFFQMKMVAAAMLWMFQIQVVEGHPVTPKLSISLGMKHGLKVKVTKRCIS
ncbi:unnamed protein product [Vicia faba]|uniref:Cytochrome P450 n=1 Tax=Vicia faba TaxID=3906 RepID=A0AAV1A8K8_VICFA|nr:unnamed protein product [Vicia faba]